MDNGLALYEIFVLIDHSVLLTNTKHITLCVYLHHLLISSFLSFSIIAGLGHQNCLFIPKMCVHKLIKSVDNLGNNLDHVSFMEDKNDTCDYLDPTEGMTWYSTSKDLTVLQLNIRGLINKQNDLLNLVNRVAGKNKLDVIMLQEMWITGSNAHLINIPGYKVYLNNRTHKKGGGVAILINAELNSRKLNELCINEPYFESCVIEMQLNSCKVAVGSIYRPPNTKEKLFTQKLAEMLTKFKNSRHEILIGTDHNMDLLKSNNHNLTQNLLESILEKYCIPTITRPT